MKFVLLAVLALSVLNVALAFESSSISAWNDFKLKHNKIYASQDEEEVRFAIWKMNVNKVNRHNRDADKGVHTYRLGMNKLADLTPREFQAIYNGFKPSLKLNSIKPISVFGSDPNAQVPDSVDWRKEGYVTPIKDQGQCGSCWSFSATGSLEGQHFKKSGKLVSLSEQNLVDCSKSYGNMGCNGGLMDQAFAYIKGNNGIDTEASYPYHARDQKCTFDRNNVGATDIGYTDIKSQETYLTQAIATVGPISVAIDASHDSFQLYSSGIYYEPDCSSTELDHGVLAVGYGSEGKSDYYIVKNSWGTSWGDEGYIKMARNKNNNCGIATMASFPLL